MNKISILIQRLTRKKAKAQEQAPAAEVSEAATRQPSGGKSETEQKAAGIQNTAGSRTSPSREDLRKAPVIEAAATLARQLHKGQLDKAGMDYFEGHLTSVANSGTNWMEKTVGYLHDAAEDTYHSVPQIIQKLKETLAETPADNSYVPPTYEEWQEITEALELLNANTAPSREAYIERFRGHALAIRVKLNDLSNNMELSRIPAPADRDIIRLDRYRKEYARLNEMLDASKRQ